jgi:hypothetical protein
MPKKKIIAKKPEDEAKKLQDEAKKPEDEAKKLQDEAKKLQDKAKKLQDEAVNNLNIVKAAPTLYTTDEDVNKLFDPFIIINAHFNTIVKNVTHENNSNLNDYIDNTFKYTFEKIKNLYITIQYLVKGLLQDATYNMSPYINSNINILSLILESVNANFNKIKTLLKTTEDILLLYKNNSEIKEHLYNCIICEKRTETYIKTASAYLDINNIKAYENAYKKYENAKEALTYLYNESDPAKKTQDNIPKYIKIIYNNYVSDYKEAKTAHEEAKRLFYFNKKDEKTPPIYILQFLDKIEDNITEIDILKKELLLIYNNTPLNFSEDVDVDEEAPPEQVSTSVSTPVSSPVSTPVSTKADYPDLNKNLINIQGAKNYVDEYRIEMKSSNYVSVTSRHIERYFIPDYFIRLIFSYCSEYHDDGTDVCEDIFKVCGKTATFYKIYMSNELSNHFNNNFNNILSSFIYTTLTKLYNDSDSENDCDRSHLLSIKVPIYENNTLIYTLNKVYTDHDIYILGMKDDKVDIREIYKIKDDKDVSTIPPLLQSQLKYILYLGKPEKIINTDNDNTNVNFRIKSLIYVYSKPIIFENGDKCCNKISIEKYDDNGFTKNVLYCVYNIDFITFTKDYLDYIVEKGKETETIKPKKGILQRLKAFFVPDKEAYESSRAEANKSKKVEKPKRPTRLSRLKRQEKK